MIIALQDQLNVISFSKICIRHGATTLFQDYSMFVSDDQRCSQGDSVPRSLKGNGLLYVTPVH